MELLPEIDEKKTIKNVVHFLSGHKVRVLRAGRSISSLQSPRLDGMPKSPSKKNTAGGRLAESAQAQQEVDETVRAVSCLDSNSRLIIERLFIDEAPWTNTDVARELNFERTKYNRLKRWALLSFAEAYRLDDFRIKKRTNMHKSR